jgi:hypothetical protein
MKGCILKLKSVLFHNLYNWDGFVPVGFGCIFIGSYLSEAFATWHICINPSISEYKGLKLKKSKQINCQKSKKSKQIICRFLKKSKEII